MQRAVGLLLLRQPLIHPHQLRHAGAFAVQLAPKAICLHHGLVVLLMGLAQFRGHGGFVIQVGKTAIRVELPGVQNRLGGLLDPGPLLVRGRGPGEVVVNHIFGIAIVAFQPTTHGPHPCHVDIRGQNAEVVQRCIWNCNDKVCGNSFFVQKSNGNILSAFRRDCGNNDKSVWIIDFSELCRTISQFAAACIWCIFAVCFTCFYSLHDQWHFP